MQFLRLTPTAVASPFGPVANPRARSGLALIVVLFAVALISIVVLAYFSLAMANRNISFSSAGQARANIIALSALDYVKGDLISEIQYGSTNEIDPNSSVVVYYPNTNTTMVPYRMTANLATPDYTLPPNLVKWSSATIPQWPSTAAYGAQVGPLRGSTSSTTSPSVDGHFLTAGLWAKPVFGTNTTITTTAAIPQWVYLSRQGPLTPTVATASNIPALKNPTSANYVIGRYAYTVYDEGGLLDVAAAGYSPDTFASDATDVGRKGSQGFADLTQLNLTQAQIDTLVSWRNASSWNNTSTYVGYLTTNAPGTGFRSAATNDQAFVGRQDLIAFLTSPAQMTTVTSANTNALMNLTTFSREKNAPSWGPEHDANDANSPTYWNGMNTESSSTPSFDSVTWNDPSGGISYAYHTSKDTPSANNRFFPDVRVKSTALFTRLSKEPALAGEPLVKNRFDLSKLAWITYKGPSGDLPATDPLYNAAGTDANIYNYFGLVANNSSGVFTSWIYDHSNLTLPALATVNSTTSIIPIMTLDQVATAGREPDFFELLQATILRGSLGLCSGDPSQENVNTDIGTGGEFFRAVYQLPASPAQPAMDQGGAIFRPMNNDPGTPPHVVNAQAMYQIIQIGANIIDQYTSDNFPTQITLNQDNFYGIKNLPYINAIGDAALRVAAQSPPAAASPYAMTYDVTCENSGTSMAADTTISGATLNQQYVHRWLDFALWNPNQNAKNPPSLTPTKIRICAVGGREYPYIVGLGNGNNVVTGDYSGRQFEPPGTPVNTPSAGNPGYADGPAWIGVNLNDTSYNSFTEPTVINPATAFTSLTDNALDAASLNINAPDGIVVTTPPSGTPWQRAGIYLGWSRSPDNPYKVPACVAYWPAYATANTPSLVAGPLPSLTPNKVLAGVNMPIPLTFYLQYEDINSPGTWHTYQEIRNLYYSRNQGGGDPYMEPSDTSWTAWTKVPTNPSTTSTVTQLIYGSTTATPFTGLFPNMDTALVAGMDPRTTRPNMGNWHGDQNNRFWPSPLATGSDSMITSTFNTINEPAKGFSTGAHFINFHFAKSWIDNISIAPQKNYDTVNTTTVANYTDRDGIARLGDAAGWTNVVLPPDAPTTSAGASPLVPGAQMQRPLQLNRPFRSVAELGYVFRDDPWKTLNLFSANSADAGLMDVFYIGSSATNAPATPPPDVIAGKMNINSAALNAVYAGTTPSSPVLQSLFSRSLRDYKSPSSLPTTLDTSIATTADLQSLSTSVVNYIKTSGPLINISDLPGIFPQVPAATPPTPLYTGLKNPSEAFIRSLADGTGTRTWNLMIDIVAQAGKFNPAAANLNNFTVDGEKHYWLHVAIDRFTGEIVDQQLEPVWE